MPHSSSHGGSPSASLAVLIADSQTITFIIFMALITGINFKRMIEIIIFMEVIAIIIYMRLELITFIKTFLLSRKAFVLVLCSFPISLR